MTVYKVHLSYQKEANDVKQYATVLVKAGSETDAKSKAEKRNRGWVAYRAAADKETQNAPAGSDRAVRLF